MRIIVTANKVPFLSGGADYQVRGLVTALQAHGHEVELLQLPFRFSPEEEVLRLMEFAEHTDLNRPNGVRVDRLISLQFPGYAMRHDHHRVWVMHQHRAVYELYERQAPSEQLQALREQVSAFDGRALGRVEALFANSRRVAERLRHYNGLPSQPIYHPPYGRDDFHCAEPLEYFFYPSRLETLKRQDLVIEAAALMKSPARILIGGVGGQQRTFQQLITKLDVADRVQLIGRFSEAEKLVLYARSLGVLFVPHDEDYGYITLEAMLSSKPVITCTDSGGSLEFVEHENNGQVVAPEAAQLAAAMDDLHQHRRLAAAMGARGRQLMERLAISWDQVVEQLLA